MEKIVHFNSFLSFRVLFSSVQNRWWCGLTALRCNLWQTPGWSNRCAVCDGQQRFWSLSEMKWSYRVQCFLRSVAFTIRVSTPQYAACVTVLAAVAAVKETVNRWVGRVLQTRILRQFPAYLTTEISGVARCFLCRGQAVDTALRSKKSCIFCNTDARTLNLAWILGYLTTLY